MGNSAAFAGIPICREWGTTRLIQCISVIILLLLLLLLLLLFYSLNVNIAAEIFPFG